MDAILKVNLKLIATVPRMIHQVTRRRISSSSPVIVDQESSSCLAKSE